MKKILIITERTLHSAPRVIRAIDALDGHFEIHTVGLSMPVKPVQSHTDRKIIRESNFGRVIRKIRRDYFGHFVPLKLDSSSKSRKIEKLIRGIKPDIVMCHECIDIPYVVKLKSNYNFKIIFNAHEYYPLEHDDKPDWSSTWQVYYENLYATYLPHVDLFINVCESIREKCIEKFNKDSIVIPNAAFYSDLNPSEIGNKIRIIHHGGANPSRKIEEMIKMAGLLGGEYELDLMLVPNNKNYYEELKSLAKNLSNVNFINPVAYNEITSTLNSYDIGLYILPPTSYNNAIALPNKLFEFIQAKLCIAIGPSPEMKRIVVNNELGIVAEDFTSESLADRIKKISREDIMSYKQNSIKASNEYSAERFNNLFLNKLLNL